QEPYARGETLISAFYACLLPRFLAPEKVRAGGRENMERFAGVHLEGTSMNLGYGGEMYANFGHIGGFIGCGLYALAFSLLFRAISLRAFKSPLWWSVLPYIALWALKAEDGLAEVFNWTA